MDDLLREFLTETNDGLAALDVDLVALEQDPGNPALLGGIFRLMHTIKGTCGFLDLPRLEALAHAGEGVLGRLRDNALEATPQAVSPIFQWLDRTREIVLVLEQSGREPDGDDGDLILRLNALAEPGAVPAEPVDEPAIAALAEPGPARQSIRVQLDLLEDLMSQVGELVLARNQCLQLLSAEPDSHFTAPLRRLDQVVSRLQDDVMKTRMQSVGKAWARLPRIVRDLALELGKQIELVMSGGDTELDRQLLELIGDALTHMVRNAADHGLEVPEERLAAGKPETGRIALTAWHEGGQIVIELSDDGRGLTLEEIRRKARDRGLFGAEEIAGLSDQQAMQLIFEPGFSTAAQVTAVSGRGVGMDVVRSNVEKIGGIIALTSRAGEGTSFRIKIPLALAIVPALIVESGGQRFAIPQLCVSELVRVAPDAAHRIERIGETPLLRLRERLLPLVKLAELLRLPGRAEGHIVLCQVGASRFGIVVDRVLDTQEIVVKPVAPVLRDLSLYSGNTILGDGSVVMILDPNGIAAAVGEVPAGAQDAQTAVETPPGESAAAQVAMLLFRAGGGPQKAVQLSRVARIVEVDLAEVTRCGGRHVVPHDGRLMPLVALDGAEQLPGRGRRPVLVLAGGDQALGLLADSIIDSVEAPVSVDLAGGRPGLIGSAVIGGQATEIIDPAHYLGQAFGGGAGDREDPGPQAGRRVLLVDDSPFFRDILAPLLSSAGYQVTSVASAAEALALCDAGQDYDVIVSDLEQPARDGLALAATIRGGTRWRATPMVALSDRATPRDQVHGRLAGFDKHLAKSDRKALLSALEDTLNRARGAA